MIPEGLHEISEVYRGECEERLSRPDEGETEIVLKNRSGRYLAVDEEPLKSGAEKGKCLYVQNGYVIGLARKV